MKSIAWIFIVFALFAGWLSTGFYSVSPQETGITFILGQCTNRQIPSGLHYHVPWPLGSVCRVETTTMKSMPIGFRLIDQAAQIKPTPQQCEWLTGDTNVLRIQLLVQYLISDPYSYRFAGKSPEEILRSAGEAAVTHMVGRMAVDDALTTGWALLSKQIIEEIQSHLDRCRCGLTVVNVQRIAIEPPDEVREAFQDVTNARQDKSRLITQARVYREEILPRARGQAEQLIAQAEGKQSIRIASAQGDMEKFLAILPEVRNASDAVKIRFYRETMEKVLPRLQKHILVRSPDGSTLPIRIFSQKNKSAPPSAQKKKEETPPFPDNSEMMRYLQDSISKQN
ncbi:MAG: FtsH protease activity modulator HflK [Candidatus Omnitrophota bacterium]|jgi:membrane protease subunit HflK|nr:MAG: FtsH protease activity modulator HflK [Candidatus Omnitrophota bacterium]